MSELECVEGEQSLGSLPEPLLEPQPPAEREIFHSSGKSAPEARTTDTSGDTWITDTNDLEQFRELAVLLRTGSTPADDRPVLVHAQRSRRNVRRLRRKLDRKHGGYERRRDRPRVSPAPFLRSELRGVSGMGYPEMLRGWKALGGRAETLEGANSAGPYHLKREPMDFNRHYVYPAVALAERGAA